MTGLNIAGKKYTDWKNEYRRPRRKSTYAMSSPRTFWTSMIPANHSPLSRSAPATRSKFVPSNSRRKLLRPVNALRWTPSHSNTLPHSEAANGPITNTR